ncbi:MAG TPA: hypothetical protein VMW50_13180 [Dehalococcoidia bacterium]|nr:hypothetical protein [Dehalococcoidia bacterium]
MMRRKDTGKTIDNEFVGLPEGEPQIPGETESELIVQPISEQRIGEVIALSDAITDLIIKYPGTGVNHFAGINLLIASGLSLENAITIYQGVMFKKFGY